MKILVINGPNINMLGLREPGIYGSGTYEALLSFVRSVCEKEGIEVSFFQSNHEGDIVDCIQKAYGEQDGIVINRRRTHIRVSRFSMRSRLFPFLL